MKKIKFAIAAVAMAAAMGSCSDENMGLTGEGYVMFNPTFSADVQVVTSRATDQLTLRQELGESFTFWLNRINGSGQAEVIRTYQGLDNMPDKLTLAPGSYVAEAWAGDSVPASFTQRWFKAAVPFDVTAGNSASVDVDCHIANVVVSFEYEDSAAIFDKFDVNSMIVQHSRGRLDFTDRSHERGYFMMPSTDTDLTWQFNATRLSDNTEVQFSGTLKDVKPGYEYKYVISMETPATPGADPVGGAYLNITINETEIPAYGQITLNAAPAITGVDFDIDQTLVGQDELDPFAVYIAAASKLQSVVLSCDDFPTLLTISGTQFDVFGAKTQVVENINNHGISWLYATKSTEEGIKGDLKIYFKSELVDALVADKEYTITITATDDTGLATTKTLRFMVSNAPISIVTPPATGTDDPNADPYSYTIEGVANNLPDGTDVTVYYAAADPLTRAEWASVATTVADGRFAAKITSLKGGHEYQYYVVTGDYTSPVYSFTTIAPQLPNCGFEGWQTSSTPYLIYGADEQMFWDSGNHGSATMKKNVTVPDATLKHSGDYSIKLASQFVGVGSIGKFAAGNVFIGKYLGTEGTDGILGFGRPFTYRPTKVRGYVRYEPGSVKYTNENAPDIVKGELDKGIIYVALLSDQTDPEYPEFPVVIKTKSSQLFDKNASNVIGYGELVFHEATAGDGFVEFEISIDYRSDARPGFIMMTASASKGGDYFSGGVSNMWLDDIELVYE